MSFWRFADYHSSGGRNLFKEWYDLQVPAVQAACDYAIQETAGTENLEECLTFTELEKQDVGLCQVRFRADDSTGTGRRQFRAIGFWDYDRANIILVSGGRKPIPETVFADTLDIQLQYFRYGQGSIYEHRF